MRKLAIATLCSASVTAWSGWIEPDNYDDCILEGMKNVKTDAAVTVITRACRRKFPEKTAEPLNGAVSDWCIRNTPTIHGSFGDYLCLQQKEGKLPHPEVKIPQ